MDKYEYKLRSEEISKLINEENYAQAVKIADSIDWRRVKSATMLLKISALYRITKRNEDSRSILLLAYDRYPTNRSVVYSLCELSIELDDVVAAIEYLKQFAKIAPDDSGVYVLRYRILEAQDANFDELIEILEDLKVKDYQVEWVYELAYLYHRAGYSTKCVETCDELMLWIGDGPYVMKAMELKAMHVPLTEEQQAKYNFMLANSQSNYSASGYDREYDANYDANYDENGNYIGDDGYDASYDENGNYIGDDGYDASYDENGNYIGDDGYDANYDENGNYIGDESYDANYDANYSENGNYIDDGYHQEVYYEQQSYEETPQQPAQAAANADMSQYNTINLQKVLAESMREIFPDDDVFAEERERLNANEVYANDPADAAPDNNTDSESVATEEENTPNDTIVYGKFGEEAPASMEEDEADENSPMTGQMRLDDVLAEWERTKQNNAKRHQEEIRNQIFTQTGQMFADFDTSVNNDIMSKLDDSGKVTVKGSSIVASRDDDNDGIEELEEIEETGEEMSELEKAVANELGGNTHKIPSDAINEELAMVKTNAAQGDDEGYEESQDEQDSLQNAYDEISDIEIHNTDSIERLEAETSETGVDDENEGLDPEDEQDIAAMAKEDAIRTQEIKLNTADLSVLSEKIVETTNKEASGAKREEIREFTDDEQSLFENFAVTRKIKKQIINALDSMSLAAYTGNVIITGDAGIDTLRMAKNLIKEYQMLDSNFSGKIAKISGEKINERDLKDIFDKLDNGSIIIEKANGMSEEKLYEMATQLNQENLGIVVIMVDTKKEITKLLEKQAMIADYFNIRIDLMEMDNNALVAYAKNYALALEYAIDELGTLALYTRIANMQSGNHVVTKDEVRDIIDEAIHKSKKSKIKNFVDVLFSRRYDNEDMIVLKERDFI